VIVVGFVIGADKGSLRVLPGGVHQVSTSLNNGNWTTVSPQQYEIWDARFVREDAFFGIFALALIGSSLLMLAPQKGWDNQGTLIPGLALEVMETRGLAARSE